MGDGELSTLLQKLPDASHAEREQITKELLRWVFGEASRLLRRRHPEVGFLCEEIANGIAADLVCDPQKRNLTLKATRPANYVRRMIVYAFYDRFRGRDKELVRLDELQLSSLEDEGSARSQDLVDVAELIASLRHNMSPDEQDLVVMRFWEDLAFKQIAERLGIKPNTAARRLYRLLDRLRHMLIASGILKQVFGNSATSIYTPPAQIGGH